MREDIKEGKKKIVGQYEIFLNIKLGGGGFGTVYQGYNRNTKQIVAVKMIQRQDQRHGSIKQQYLINALKRQTIILSKISSENVVAFKDILSTKRYYYIVQQKCDGDLRGYLASQKQNRVSQQKAIQFMTQILNGFFALILTNVIHRDIKPQNFLMKDGKLKIADFGLSRRVTGDEMLVSAVGTKAYSAPQIIVHQKYTSKCDIWSLGCLFYQMLYGRPLFPVPNHKLYQKMKQIDKYGVQFPIEPQVSEKTKQIITRCLKLKQQERADWAQLFNNPYFVKKLPSLRKLHTSLHFIIAAIRKEINQKNFDLQQYFKGLGLSKQDQLRPQMYEKIISQLLPNKITIQQIKFSFTYFDGDRSGKVSFQQFEDTLRKFGVEMKATSRSMMLNNIVTKVQSNFSKDQTQNFTNEEMQLRLKSEAAFQRLIKSIVQNNIQNFQQKFKQSDKDGEGIDMKQFTKLIQKELCKQLNDKQCELIFRKFDDNKDDSISYQQFHKYVFGTIKLPKAVSYIKISSSENQ